MSALCLVFGLIYESYSHEVFSGYMVYAFLIPLVFGAIPYLLLFMSGKQDKAYVIPGNLYNSSLAVFTVGSLADGVLEIYGTTNSLLSVYWIAGISLLVLSAVTYVIWHIRAKRMIRRYSRPQSRNAA